ncbi:PREDICTED: alpha carbonic anhydrase 7-like [Ipomoea nil]|uniref:alpha carbonic anhydrase 7-like n=1 Tax=Ipomoea nil TaxID=35883 RepID=UPI0009015462|nr:PREDICTED: alpha carbonic anhydrase 7-like [Ipomoea nil]
MKMKMNSLIILAFLCLVLVFHSSLIKAQEVEDEREFDYSLRSEKGPHRWGDLKVEWEACKNGEMQSPIDIMSHQRVELIRSFEHKYYKPANATIKNRGHDISIKWHGDVGSYFINGIEYPLKSAHWHSPSEHTINGRRYAMELHMVHQSPDQTLQNQIAVTSVLYRIGKPDAFLSRLMSNISLLVDEEDEEIHTGWIDPTEINYTCTMYYRYFGSLTTPPCTEGVIWTINTKIRTVSWRQMKLLREAVHDYAEWNARPLQPLNDRKIYVLI